MKISYEEWEKEGKKRYGEDKKNWIFVCPNCGYQQSFNDFIKNGVSQEETSKVIGFSCIGRLLEKTKGELFNKKSPCNYAGGGLFRLNPITVTKGEEEQSFFDFRESLIKEFNSEIGH